MIDDLDNAVFIPLLLGTNRKDRESESAAKWVSKKMEEHPGIRTQYFDARDFHLPYDDYGTSLGSQFPEWRDAMIAADGLVIVTPEYNHGYPGVLKSVLDILLKQYIHKAVAFVGVSAGPWGGTRVIESMVPMVRELGLSPTFRDLHFPRVKTKFNDAGEIADPDYEARTISFLDELVWMAATLRWGRENVPSKYHS